MQFLTQPKFVSSSKNKLRVRDNVKFITYYRNPTEQEIKFGDGAIHFLEFPVEECLNKDGTIKKVIYAKDDGLKYYY